MQQDGKETEAPVIAEVTEKPPDAPQTQAVVQGPQSQTEVQMQNPGKETEAPVIAEVMEKPPDAPPKVSVPVPQSDSGISESEMEARLSQPESHEITGILKTYGALFNACIYIFCNFIFLLLYFQMVLLHVLLVVSAALSSAQLRTIVMVGPISGSQPVKK